MSSLSTTVTFLFASDGSLTSDGLSAFLQTKSNFLLVAHCNDAPTAVEGIQIHRPEIAILDNRIGESDASDIIAWARENQSLTKFIVLGTSANRETADLAIASGADAYIVRSGPSRYLLDAIRYVMDGGKYLSPQLTQAAPLTAEWVNAYGADYGRALDGLREAVVSQSHTVSQLEQAMARAEYAIGLLQQDVKRLSVPADSTSGLLKASSRHGGDRLRSVAGSAAAVVVVGLLGFQLAGVLMPSSVAAKSPTAVPVSNLAKWQSEMIESGAGLLRDKQYAAAEKIARTLLKQNPSNLAAKQILASALFRQSRMEEASEVVVMMNPPLAEGSRPSPFRGR